MFFQESFSSKGDTHDPEDEGSGEFREIVGKRKKKKGHRQESESEDKQPNEVSLDLQWTTSPCILFSSSVWRFGI